MRDRDKELEEFLDYREKRLALYWMSLENKQEPIQPEEKTYFEIVLNVLIILIFFTVLGLIGVIGIAVLWIILSSFKI